MSRGCLVSQAINGAAALKLIAADPPEVILLDIGLPDMLGTGDGYIDLFTDLQAQRPDSAVILITARNEAELAAEMVRQGARRTERPHTIWSSRSR